MSIEARYTFALELIREAGGKALEYFNARDGLTIKNKGPQDLASEADLNTELLIRERLAKAFPETFARRRRQPMGKGRASGWWTHRRRSPSASACRAGACRSGFVKNGIIEFGMVQRCRCGSFSPRARPARRSTAPIPRERRGGPPGPHRHGLFAEERA